MQGPRPAYVAEFRVENLRFGALPPMLKNVKWVRACVRRSVGAGAAIDVGRYRLE